MNLSESTNREECMSNPVGNGHFIPGGGAGGRVERGEEWVLWSVRGLPELTASIFYLMRMELSEGPWSAPLSYLPGL